MAVLAAVAEGTSEFTGIERARIKESDRVAAVKEGLKRWASVWRRREAKLDITGGKPKGALIDSKSDHRIAMAFSLLGTVIGNTVIDRAECVAKTYPEFWDVFKNLGGKVEPMGNSLGKKFIVTSFGESHGKCIGIVIDGCPAGLPITKKIFKPNWTKENQSKVIASTKRAEEDKVDILSGIFKGIPPARPFVWRFGTKTSNRKL